MAVFSWSSRFREGQWRAFRRFMLEERRDVAARFQVIDAELQRIGEIQVLFERDEAGNTTEKRKGIVVEPADSSLGKLLLAYTSLGGNPLDISLFLTPERAIEIDGEYIPTMPGGGQLYQKNIRYSYDQGVQDGDASLQKYRPSRMGGKGIAIREKDISVYVGVGRRWISQAMRTKRTRLEERIIKLMDLREQLEQEVQDMIGATGFSLGSNFSTDEYNPSLTAASIAYFFDSTFRVPDSDDPTSIPVDDTADAGQSGSLNTSVLAGYDSLMVDEDEEENTAL